MAKSKYHPKHHDRIEHGKISDHHHIIMCMRGTYAWSIYATLTHQEIFNLDERGKKATREIHTEVGTRHSLYTTVGAAVTLGGCRTFGADLGEGPKKTE